MEGLATKSSINNLTIDNPVAKRLNEKYLNAYGSDVENYYKPANFYNLYLMNKVTAIVDI